MNAPIPSRVLHAEHGRERGRLRLDPVVEVAGVRDPLDLLDRSVLQSGGVCRRVVFSAPVDE